MYTVYRIEHKDTMAGMWRNYDGSYNGVIETLTEGLSKHLPMPYTEHHKKDGKKWFSAVKNVEDLQKWFTPLDIKELVSKGYRLYEIECSEVIDIGSEVLFARDDASTKKSVDIDLLLENVYEKKLSKRQVDKATVYNSKLKDILNYSDGMKGLAIDMIKESGDVKNV